jgi:hypothetical protein
MRQCGIHYTSIDKWAAAVALALVACNIMHYEYALCIMYYALMQHSTVSAQGHGGA